MDPRRTEHQQETPRRPLDDTASQARPGSRNGAPPRQLPPPRLPRVDGGPVTEFDPTWHGDEDGEVM